MPVLSEVTFRRSSEQAPPTALVLFPVRDLLELGPIFLDRDKVVIGSGPECTVRLPVEGVHPRHCVILAGPKRVVIKAWDLRTWLNDGPVREAALREGDRLAIGPVEFHIRRATPDELLHHLPDATHHVAPEPPSAPAEGDAVVEPAATGSAATTPPLILGGAGGGVGEERRPSLHQTPPAPPRIRGGVADLAPVESTPSDESQSLRRELLAELSLLKEQIAHQRAETARLEVERDQQLADRLQHLESQRRQQQGRLARDFAQRKIELERNEQVILDRDEKQQARARELDRQASALGAHKAVLTRRQAELDTAHERVQRDQTGLRHRQQHLGELCREVLHLQSDLLRQNRQQAGEREQLDAQVAALKSRQEAVAEADRHLAAREAELIEWEHAFRAREADLQRRADDVTAAERALATQQQELEQRELSVARHEDSCRATAAALERQTADVASLQEAWEARRREAQERDGLLSARAEELAAREQSLVERETECHAASLDLGQRAAEITELRQALSTRREELEGREQSLVAREQQACKREEALDAAQQTTERVDRHEWDTREQTLRAEADALATERQQLSAAQQQLSAERQQVAAAQLQVAAERDQLTVDLSRVAAELAALEAERQEIQAARTEVESLQAKQSDAEINLRCERERIAVSEREIAIESERLRAEREFLAAERERLLAQQRSLQEREDQLVEQSRWPAADDASTEREDVSSTATDAGEEEDPIAAVEECHASEDESEESLRLRSALSDMFGLPELRPNSTSTVPSPEATPDMPERDRRDTAISPVDVPADVATSGNSVTEAAPQPEAAADPPLNDADPDSISAYMERLLARTRRSQPGEANHSEEASVPTTPPIERPTIDRHDILSPVEKVSAASPVSGTAEPITASEPAADLPLPRRRQNPDQLRVGLSSLREVANQSARSAVAAHSWKKTRSVILAQSLLTAASFGLAGLLLGGAVTSTEPLTLHGWAAMALGVVTAANLARSWLRLRRVTSQTEASTPAPEPTATAEPDGDRSSS